MARGTEYDYIRALGRARQLYAPNGPGFTIENPLKTTTHLLLPRIRDGSRGAGFDFVHRGFELGEHFRPAGDGQTNMVQDIFELRLQPRARFRRELADMDLVTFQYWTWDEILQVNGKPALAELLRPERRIHLYGASPYWSYLHLGEARAQERAARPQLSSAAFYTELEGEALRFIRFLRLKPSPQRFSV